MGKENEKRKKKNIIKLRKYNKFSERTKISFERKIISKKGKKKKEKRKKKKEKENSMEQ